VWVWETKLRLGGTQSQYRRHDSPPGRVHCAGVSGRGCQKEWSQSSWQDLYAQTVADGFMWKKMG